VDKGTVPYTAMRSIAILALPPTDAGVGCGHESKKACDSGEDTDHVSFPVARMGGERSEWTGGFENAAQTKSAFILVQLRKKIRSSVLILGTRTSYIEAIIIIIVLTLK